MKRMFAIPVSTHCQEVALLKEHALIGVSPFNSYFSEEKITALIRWGLENFQKFHLFVPNTLPYFNFLAMGYSVNEARKKTKHQWNYLRNKIYAAFGNVNLSGNEVFTRIVTTEDLENNLAYLNLRQLCIDKYNNDPSFKEKCLHASEQFLRNQHKVDNGIIHLEESVKYLLGELPLYLNTPLILNVPSSVFIYHKHLRFFEELYTLRDNESLANSQGHLILDLQEIGYEKAEAVLH